MDWLRGAATGGDDDVARLVGVCFLMNSGYVRSIQKCGAKHKQVNFRAFQVNRVLLTIISGQEFFL